MGDMLKKLFAGDIDPTQVKVRPDSEYRMAQQQLNQKETALRESLSPAQCRMLNELLEAESALLLVASQEYYIMGFRTGGRLMLDLMEDDGGLCSIT